MNVIVNTGSTLSVTSGGLSITSDSTVASGGLLDGLGTVVGNFNLLNLGTIAADVPGTVLSVDTGTLTNHGTILANNATLTIQAAATDLSATTLAEGVWEASGTGAVEFLSGQIVTDDATIILNGTASTIDGFDTGHGTLQPIDNSLVTVGTAGMLDLPNGRNFSASTSLVVEGTVTLGGGTLAAPADGLTIGATGDVVGFGTIDPGTVVDDSGTIEASGGTLTIPQVGNMTGAGTLQADAGASLVLQDLSGGYAQSIVNNGTIIDAASQFLGNDLTISGVYTGTGEFLVQGGADNSTRTILDLPSGVSANVMFDPNVGELVLEDVSSFNGAVSGFGDSDRIVDASVANVASATLDGNDLNLRNLGGTVLQTITFNAASMDYSSAVFTAVENISNTAATVTVADVQPACFAAGTRIKTRSGEVPVEHLRAGDVVHARFAGTAPVVWIGHRHIDCKRHPVPSKVWPVRVAAHAFGPRMPSQDLVLSPDHAVFVDDVLIPIKHLINGKTIVQQQADAVTYYHVELAEHDVLLAEGMPAESYLESGERGAFDNAGGVIALHPDFGTRRREAFGCAPLIVTGAVIDAVAARLRARAPKGRRAGRTARQVA